MTDKLFGLEYGDIEVHEPGDYIIGNHNRK